MDGYTIESFIDFCDNYQIAEEGSLSNFAKKVWINIQTILKKLLQIFKNLLMKVNYLRTSKLPTQKSKDLLLVIQNLNPRYEVLNKTFMMVYKTASIENMQRDKEYTKRMEELKREHPDSNITIDHTNAYDELSSEIEQSLDDVTSVVRDATSSSEYKRIQEDNYNNNQISEIPLSNIITAMKKAENSLISYEGNAKKMALAEENPKSEAQKRAAGKCRELFSKICEAYKMQIRLLKIFFDNAKVTATAVGKNIKEKVKKENDPNRNYANAKSMVGMLIKQGAVSKTVKVTPEQKKRFEEFDKQITECNNKPENFEKYKKAYEEICKIAKTSPNCVLIYDVPGGNRSGMLPAVGENEIAFMVMKDNNKPMKLLSNTKLYHTSDNGELKELTGRYYHTSLGIRRLWSSQRVYFSIGNAMSKDGSKFNGKDPMAKYEGTKERSLYKYEPVEHIDTVYRDVEMGIGSAVYVPTKTSIKIKKL